MFFSQGISALFSVVGFITFFVPIAAYSYVTWNIINKHDGAAINSAVAAVLLSLLVFSVSELVGFIVTSLTFLNIVPENIISATLRAHFAEQYLNMINVMLGLFFGLVIAFIGGFFGFIISEIQLKFISRVRSILLGKGNRQNNTKRTKSVAKDVRIFATLRTKKALKKIKTALKQMTQDI